MITETRAYVVDQQGLIEIISVLTEDGTITDIYGYPLVDTGAGVEELVGWPDRWVRVYRNSGGLEILVPVDITDLQS